MAGDRHNDGKPRLSYVLEAPDAISGIAEVMHHSTLSGKYARGNWKQGLSWTETADSLLRHLTAFVNGEDIDPDSGKPHVDHISCNALFLGQFHRTHRQFDDRTKVIEHDSAGD